MQKSSWLLFQSLCQTDSFEGDVLVRVKSEVTLSVAFLPKSTSLFRGFPVSNAALEIPKTQLNV